MAKSADLLQGTLDLLILRTLELAPLHGVGVADRAGLGRPNRVGRRLIATYDHDLTVPETQTGYRWDVVLGATPSEDG